MELVRIPPGRIFEKIEYISGAPVIRLREDLLPLVRLADILALPRSYDCPATGVVETDRRHQIADRRSATPLPDTPENRERRNLCGTDRRFHAASALNIAVVSTGNLTYGLVVDELQDAEEIVVKPLGRHLKSCGAYAGATIMGDGRVALILDITSLADTASLTPVSHSDPDFDTAGSQNSQKKAPDRFSRSGSTGRTVCHPPGSGDPYRKNPGPEHGNHGPHDRCPDQGYHAAGVCPG